MKNIFADFADISVGISAGKVCCFFPSHSLICLVTQACMYLYNVAMSTLICQCLVPGEVLISIQLVSG